MKSILGLVADVQIAIEKKGKHAALSDLEKELYSSLVFLEHNVVSGQEGSKVPGLVDYMSVRQMKQALLVNATDALAMASLLNEQTALIKKMSVYVKSHFVREHESLMKRMREVKTRDQLDKLIPEFDTTTTNPFYPKDLLEEAVKLRATKFVDIALEIPAVVGVRKLED